MKALGSLADNIATSVTKGMPVIASGELTTEEWESDNGTHSGHVTTAHTRGHDLGLGAAVITPNNRHTNNQEVDQAVDVDDECDW